MKPMLKMLAAFKAAADAQGLEFDPATAVVTFQLKDPTKPEAEGFCGHTLSLAYIMEHEGKEAALCEHETKNVKAHFTKVSVGAEIEALRAEVAELRSQKAAAKAEAFRQIPLVRPGDQVGVQA